MKCPRLLSAAILCSLLAASGAQAGDVYKMVDKSGRSHFSDQPQPGWSRVNVTPVQPAISSEPADAAKQAQREAECQTKRGELDRYRAAMTIKETDSLGHVHTYSADERKQLIESTQKEADELCGPPAG